MRGMYRRLTANVFMQKVVTRLETKPHKSGPKSGRQDCRLRGTNICEAYQNPVYYACYYWTGADAQDLINTAVPVRTRAARLTAWIRVARPLPARTGPKQITPQRPSPQPAPQPTPPNQPPLLA